MVKNKLISLLKNNSVVINFELRIPYLCSGINGYGVVEKISVGDHNVTGYNDVCRENISQELMNDIKSAIILTIENHNNKIS